MINTINMSLLRLQINDLLYTMDYFCGREKTKVAQECLENLCLIYLFPNTYKATDLQYIKTLKSLIKRLQGHECSCEFNYSIYYDASEVLALLSILEKESLN
jgi:hypothetical protein